MSHPYTLRAHPTPGLGLVVLRVDETIEQEFRHYIPAEAARLHVTRLPSSDDVSREGLLAMGAGIAGAASLLPGADAISVVGFACTSGAAVLGRRGVAERIASAGLDTAAVTDPLTAITAQAAALGVRRLGIVSPYVADVAEGLCAAFEANGLPVVRSLSFGEEVEARVARIAPASIAAAAHTLAAQGGIDGVLLSCTNLHTAPILGAVQRELGLPVLSSNHALAWHMARLAGIEAPTHLK